MDSFPSSIFIISKFLYYWRISTTLMMFGWFMTLSMVRSRRSEDAAVVFEWAAIFRANFLPL